MPDLIDLAYIEFPFTVSERICIASCWITSVIAQTGAEEKIIFPPDDESLYAAMNDDICNCLKNNAVTEEPMDHFNDCANEAMHKNKEKVMKFLSQSPHSKIGEIGPGDG